MIQGRKVAAIILVFIVSLVSLTSYQGSVKGLELGAYHSSFEISEALMGLHENNTEISFYTTAQDLLGTRSIPGGREIPILITGDIDDDRPWIMIIGAHHGNEPDSAEAVLAFAVDLLEGYNNGNRMQTHLIEDLNIAILPVVNPYGLDMLKREDENGEDPNRDYPFEPSTARLDSDGVPLTTAGAHAVHSLAMMYPFSIALSFHTGSQGIFYPWGAPNVGDISPDGIAFDTIGMEMARSSGVNMIKGPANSYPYVADLTGAFDDHLYGSAFMSNHLYSEDMQLPWSTFTATVELNDLKDYSPGSLGDTDDLWSYPLTDTQTIPRGVRICYSACQLLQPHLDVELVKGNDTVEISGTFSGVSTLGDISLTLNGEPLEVDIDLEDHPFLPEFGFGFEIPEPETDGMHHLEISAYPDINWLDRDPLAEQNIAPASLLSRSRERISWSGYFQTGSTEPDIEPINLNATLNITSSPHIMEAGEPGYIMADIEYDTSLTLEELVIVLAIDEWEEVTRFDTDQIEGGYSLYPISTVPMAGDARITVNLTFKEGNVIETMNVELIPAIEILSVTEDPEKPNNWKILVGLQGGYGPTPVYWGVSRLIEEEWSSDNWVITPNAEIADGYGPHTIKVDLDGFGGVMYFRVSALIGTEDETSNFWKQTELNPPVGIEYTDIFINSTDEEVNFGPVIIVSRINGLEALGPQQREISLDLEIWRFDEENIIVPLTWKYRSFMSSDEIRTLNLLAIENGLDPDDVEGGYFGTVDRNGLEDEIEIWVILEGSYYSRGQNLISFNLVSGLEAYSIEEEKTSEDDDEKDFPVLLFLFLLLVAACIILITYLRYKHHWKDPVPEEERVQERPGRRPDIKRDERRIGPPERRQRERPERKRPQSPPWQR